MANQQTYLFDVTSNYDVYITSRFNDILVVGYPNENNVLTSFPTSKSQIIVTKVTASRSMISKKSTKITLIIKIDISNCLVIVRSSTSFIQAHEWNTWNMQIIYLFIKYKGLILWKQ